VVYIFLISRICNLRCFDTSTGNFLSGRRTCLFVMQLLLLLLSHHFQHHFHLHLRCCDKHWKLSLGTEKVFVILLLLPSSTITFTCICVVLTYTLETISRERESVCLSYNCYCSCHLHPFIITVTMWPFVLLLFDVVFCDAAEPLPKILNPFDAAELCQKSPVRFSALLGQICNSSDAAEPMPKFSTKKILDFFDAAEPLSKFWP